MRRVPRRAAGAAAGIAAWLCTAPLLAAPRAVVEGTMEPSLRTAIIQAIGETRSGPQNALDARRRARQAASDAEALLRSEGYYEAEITADITAAEPPLAVIKVVPGPRFQIADAIVDWVGAPPAAAAAAAAIKALALAAGAPGRAADVLAAEGRVLAALEERGYADAAAQPREVIVDHDDRTLRPTFHIEAGELVRLGPVKATIKGRTRPGWLKGLAPWRPGDVYAPEKIAKYQQRLVDTGVYEGATVALASRSEDVGGLRPVLVSVADRPAHTIEVGATYSTTQGTGVDPVGQGLGADSNLQGSGGDARWFLYNRMGMGDTLAFTLNLYDIQQKLAVQESLPHWRRADQILRYGGLIARDLTPAYDDQGGGVSAEVERHFTKTTFVTVGAGAVYVSTFDKALVNPNGQTFGQTLHLFVANLLGAVALDHSNSVLDPTRGWRFEIRGEPTTISGDRNLLFLKAQTQITGYLPLQEDAATVIAGRVKFGEILGGTIPDVPSDRRFYSGGGGSVRGYGYQQVGPRLSNNVPEGGVSLAEASLEIRERLTRRFGIVAFADAGAVGLNASPDWSEGGLGAGLGLRFDLGFAPLRLDVATPLRVRPGDARVQVYISVGQSF